MSELTMVPMAGHIYQVNRSDGGVPKTAVQSAFAGPNGLAGDRQADLRYHGGPDRALCLYSLENIVALQREGHPIKAGSIGENLTVSGLDWGGVAPGLQLAIGDCVTIEIVSFAGPCRTIAGSFRDGSIERVHQDRHPGWSRVYARVLKAGTISTGDPVTLLPTDGPASGSGQDS